MLYHLIYGLVSTVVRGQEMFCQHVHMVKSEPEYQTSLRDQLKNLIQYNKCFVSPHLPLRNRMQGKMF